MQPTYDEILAQNQKLTHQIEILANQLKEALQRIKELEEKLNSNSSNGSTPPSQDPFRQRKMKGAKGKRGGKPGHAGKARQPFKPDQVTTVVEYTPESCPHCGSEDLKAFKAVETVQTVEIPPIKPIITEHRRVRCHCQNCGKASNGQWPENFSHKLFGPKLAAFICTLISMYHLSRRNVQSLIGELLGVQFAIGTAVNIAKAMSEALESPWNEAGERIKRAAVKHSDETSWFNKHHLQWLWGARDTSTTAYFRIFGSRSRESALAFLGDQKEKALVTDRYSAYRHIAGEHQYCWSHLKRDFVKISERAHLDGCVGRMLLDLQGQLFKHWHQFKDGQVTQEELQNSTASLRKSFQLALRLGTTLECSSKTVNTCINLLKNEEKMWLFISREGVEPTNNTAERAIRPAVIWRKLSLGTQSDHGMRFVERALTIVATLRNAGISVWSFFEEALLAQINGQPAPLLP